MSAESTPTWLVGPEIPPEARIGTVLAGTYRLDAYLGQGVTGITYKAWHLGRKCEFAVKLLRRSLEPSQERVTRLRADLRVLARIEALGVMPWDVNFAPDGAPFLSARLLSGRSLRQQLQEGPLPATAAGALVMAVARALQAAHVSGVFHGDLRPENIFLPTATKSPTMVLGPVLLDGALHQLRSQPMALDENLPPLKRAYLAPEHAGAPWNGADAGGDMFALGAILYEALTGQPAFAGGALARPGAPPRLSPADAVTAPSGLLAALDVIVAGACAQQPEARIPSMEMLLAALAQSFAGAGVPMGELLSAGVLSNPTGAGLALMSPPKGTDSAQLQAEETEARRMEVEHGEQARQRAALAAGAQRRYEEAMQTRLAAERIEADRAGAVRRQNERVLEARRHAGQASDMARLIALAEAELAEVAQQQSAAELRAAGAALDEARAKEQQRQLAAECARLEAQEAEQALVRQRAQLAAIRARSAALCKSDGGTPIGASDTAMGGVVASLPPRATAPLPTIAGPGALRSSAPAPAPPVPTSFASPPLLPAPTFLATPPALPAPQAPAAAVSETSALALPAHSSSERWSASRPVPVLDGGTALEEREAAPPRVPDKGAHVEAADALDPLEWLEDPATTQNPPRRYHLVGAVIATAMLSASIGVLTVLLVQRHLTVALAPPFDERAETRAAAPPSMDVAQPAPLPIAAVPESEHPSTSTPTAREGETRGALAPAVPKGEIPPPPASEPPLAASIEAGAPVAVEPIDAAHADRRADPAIPPLRTSLDQPLAPPRSARTRHPAHAAARPAIEEDAPAGKPSILDGALRDPYQ